MLRNCCVSCWDVQVPCTCTHVQCYAQSSSSQCAWSQSSRFFEFEQWFKMDLRVKARKRRKKTKWRSLKASQTCGEIDVSNSKSLFYHTPNAQARNCGKMHVSDPFFIKRTWIFCCDKMKNAHILWQITLFCSISLWNDLSVRVVTYDWTVVFYRFQRWREAVFRYAFCLAWANPAAVRVFRNRPPKDLRQWFRNYVRS